MINIGSRYNSGLSGQVADIAKQIKSLKAAQLFGGSATQTIASKASWQGTLPRPTTDFNTGITTDHSVKFNFYPDKQLADGLPMVLVSAKSHNTYFNKNITQMLSVGEASKNKLVFYGDFNNLSGGIDAIAYSQTGGRLEAETYAYQHF